MTTPVSIIPKEMPTSDVLRAILVCPSAPHQFKDESLYAGIQSTATTEPAAKRLLLSLETTLGFLEVGGLLALSGDCQHYHLTRSGRRLVEGALTREYGPHIVDEINPLADLIWKNVKAYNPLQGASYSGENSLLFRLED